MKHLRHPRAVAALSAVAHLQTKSGDPLEALTVKMAKFTDEVITRTEAAETKAAEAVANTLEIAQKFAARRLTGMDDFPAETWGKQFTRDDRLADFSNDHSRPGRFRLDVKTVTSAGLSAGVRDPEIVSVTRTAPRIRDLLTVVSVSSGNSVEYVEQVTAPRLAAPVAEGQLKPESAMVLALRSVPTQVIAHWIPASRQVLSDMPQLADLIDTELRAGLDEVEDRQVLSGDGQPPNLHGMISQAQVFNSPIALGTGATSIDVIAAAILQNALADFPADGIVMHPADLVKMRLLKDAEGRYILGNPAADTPPQLWGLPVVATKAIPAGSFLVGAFKVAATLYDRWAASVMVSTEHADFFTRNLVAILAEKRIALAVKRPAALTYGQFAA
ncbi:phage major capsid protein [Paracoccus sphaerophysae]|uniref:phage major capsid protein n=1 Tax=Paracoccus sphaerophysae TaxID=690417 RepID=UPI002358E4FE|nr:phage major capsid protein [Paracoccus sphaerophysae]